ncbi:MAG: HD domain-containing protein [Ferruginibacter sp.]
MKMLEEIRSNILLKLEKNLAKDLYYHCLEHTIDVAMQAKRIAIEEGITDKESLFLLEIACLYHDSGFLNTYKDHEVESGTIARKDLGSYDDISPDQVQIICGIIMATKIPHTPISNLEQVICDADLDYLGRDDFGPISNNLYRELKAKNFVANENEWNLIQVKFFKQHHYFTATNKNLRAAIKQQHLELIEATIV